MGKVQVSGSKNAALPLIAATLLTDEPVTLTNVPNISDVNTFLEILREMGSDVHFENNTLTICHRKVRKWNIEGHIKACKFRASILLLGPLLARFNKVKAPYPGGCIIGKRPIAAHLHGLQLLGAKIVAINENIHLKTDLLRGTKIIMPEISVTGTENIIMASVLAKGETEIRLAATEPHVQDLCRLLTSMGAKIKGIGTHNLTITGVRSLKGAKHRVIGDYLEVGTLAIASVLTQGEVEITGFDPNDLGAFWNKLSECGARFEIKNKAVHLFPCKKLTAPSRLESRTYPGFPTDLQAPFGVLLTQCQGISKIFETLFEGRLNYLLELEKMGAQVEVYNPHQAMIVGPTRLRGTIVTSLDLRAGAAMVLAGLIAKGQTEVTNIMYIDRGYDRLAEKLTALGADIKRVE